MPVVSAGKRVGSRKEGACGATMTRASGTGGRGLYGEKNWTRSVVRHTFDHQAKKGGVASCPRGINPSKSATTFAAIFRTVLQNEDGQPVVINDRACEIQADFEVGRPPGLKPGTAIDFPLAINMSQLNLVSGAQYVWKCFIDDETDESWRLGFSTRSSS